MSADNGIYVLKTLVAAPEGAFLGYEYRVAHGQCIENLHYNVETGQYDEKAAPEEMYRYFKECHVFYDEGQALIYAHRLAEQQVVLEYGVCVIDESEQTFREFTDEQLKAYDDRIDELIRQHREARQKG